MRIVAALGGNALLKRGEPMNAATQRANVRGAAKALAVLVAEGHELILTHGNGPQVGLLALQAANAGASAFPLDVLGAETEGMIGYMIQQELENRLGGRIVAALLTAIRVDRDDPAFKHPTKPIGPIYDEATARELARERGWTVAMDGSHWRRVVPSPAPVEILDARTISLLVERRIIVICAGGGGIPVVRQPTGGVIGVEAVIDKDLASALIARELEADMLLLLTDVDAVYRHYGTAKAAPMRHVRSNRLDPNLFSAGSMRPKVEAAADFATASGRSAAIGRLEDAVAIVNGKAGTLVMPPSHPEKKSKGDTHRARAS